MLSWRVKIVPRPLFPAHVCCLSTVPSSFSVLSPAFSCSSFFSSLSKKNVSLTPLFSFFPFNSFALLFTLKPVSPVLATHTKSTPGYPLTRHQIGTIVPIGRPASRPTMSRRCFTRRKSRPLPFARPAFRRRTRFPRVGFTQHYSVG